MSCTTRFRFNGYIKPDLYDWIDCIELPCGHDNYVYPSYGQDVFIFYDSNNNVFRYCTQCDWVCMWSHEAHDFNYYRVVTKYSIKDIVYTDTLDSFTLPLLLERDDFSVFDDLKIIETACSCGVEYCTEEDLECKFTDRFTKLPEVRELEHCFGNPHWWFNCISECLYDRSD